MARLISANPELLVSILSRKVGEVMKTRGLMLFERRETGMKPKTDADDRYRNYPVVDEDNRFWV